MKTRHRMRLEPREENMRTKTWRVWRFAYKTGKNLRETECDSPPYIVKQRPKQRGHSHRKWVSGLGMERHS
jgi:hypothetical protein